MFNLHMLSLTLCSLTFSLTIFGFVIFFTHIYPERPLETGPLKSTQYNSNLLASGSSTGVDGPSISCSLPLLGLNVFDK